MKLLSEKAIDRMFEEFYLKKETILSLCQKYEITRYRFYKLKNSYPKKNFFHYELKDWVRACVEQDPKGSAADIRSYLSYVNKMEYTLEEIEKILSTL